MAELTTSSFFGDLWDTATGVFDKVIDFEIFKAQLDLARDSVLFQAELDAIQAPVGSTSFSDPDSTFLSNFPLNTVLLVAGGIGLVVWAARKL